MMENKFIGLMVGLTVGVLMVSGFLWPVVADATATTEKVENTGYYYLDKYGTDESITINWDHTKPKVLTVNDEDVPVEGLPLNQWVSLVVGDTWGLRYANGGTLFFTSFAYGTMQSIGASTQDNKDLTIVCENGTATATPYTAGTAGTSASVSYSEIYIIANEGDYVMKKSNESVNMAGDTPIVAFGNTTLDAGYACMVKLSGSIEGGIIPTILASTTGAAEVVADSVVVNSSELTNYVGYSLENIQFEISDRDTNHPATYSYFIVPAMVTLEKAHHLDTMQIAMIGVIGTLGAIVLIAAAAGSIRRLD